VIVYPSAFYCTLNTHSYIVYPAMCQLLNTLSVWSHYAADIRKLAK